MKILQINKFFYLKGGAEKYYFDLAELLEKKGHSVFVLSTNHPKNFRWSHKENFVSYADFSQSEGPIKNIKKTFNIFWNFEAGRKLKKIISEHRPDVAHLHNIFHHLSPSIIYTLKKANIPMVMTLHDYKLFCPNYKFYTHNKVCYDCLKNKNYKSCLSKKCVYNSYVKSLICAWEGKWNKYLRLTDKIDAFIAPSRFIRQKAILSGIDKKKIHHLPNFLENSEDLIQTENKSKNYFLYFGRLSHEKGIDVLIKAFQKIALQYPKWQLRIVGDGPQLAALQKIADHHKTSSRQIMFLRHQNKEQLQDLIKQSYLVVQPSVWPENYPYSVLESFLQQKSVIGTLVGGLPEMIKHNENGLIVRPNNIIELASKLSWAIENPQKIRQMGQSAQMQVIIQNNSEKYYKEIIKIYEQIIH